MLPLFCPSSVVEHRHEYDQLIKGFWIFTVHVFLNMLLDVKSGRTGNTCQMKCTSRAATLYLFDKSVFVPHVLQIFVHQILDGSRFETPSHSVESENTRTSILIYFAAGSLSNVILDHRNVFQTCKVCMLNASLRSINMFTCRSTDCIKAYVLEQYFIHRHPSEVFVILGKAR